MEYEMNPQDTEQLLREAGCEDSFVQSFLRLMAHGSIEAQLRLLREQRYCQLDRIHVEERKLDRLDYLRCALEKQLPVCAKGRAKKVRV